MGAVPRLLPARLGIVLALLAGTASGCVGQQWSNDDKVDSTSVRPDPREHTLGAPGGADDRTALGAAAQE